MRPVSTFCAQLSPDQLIALCWQPVVLHASYVCCVCQPAWVIGLLIILDHCTAIFSLGNIVLKAQPTRLLHVSVGGNINSDDDAWSVGARVVAKAHPEEKVGVFARRGAHVEVVEYSEMDPQEAASVDPSKPIHKPYQN